MKTGNLTQSSPRNDPINRQMQGFSFRIFEDEDGVQDVIFSFSLDQTLNFSIQTTRKWIKNALEQTAHDFMEYTWRIWDLIANLFFVVKKTFKENDFEAQPLDEDSSRWTIAIVRPFNRIGVLWWSSDLDRAITIKLEIISMN